MKEIERLIEQYEFLKKSDENAIAEYLKIDNSESNPMACYCQGSLVMIEMIIRDLKRINKEESK